MRAVLTASAVVLALVGVAACADDAVAEPVTIIPIGDSMTDSVGTGTYRCYLDAMLTEAGVEFDFVGSFAPLAENYTCPTDFDRDHEAVSGATIDQRGGAALDIVEELQPDVALVLLGIGDLNGLQPPGEVVDELVAFVEDLQRAQEDLTILVADYPACRSASAWCQEGYPAVNEGIATFSRLSTERSAVIPVDMSTGFSLDDLRDAVHPNAAGDEEMARRWMTGLVEAGIVDPTSDTQ